jgi:hypothetical protein
VETSVRVNAERERWIEGGCGSKDASVIASVRRGLDLLQDAKELKSRAISRPLLYLQLCATVNPADCYQTLDFGFPDQVFPEARGRGVGAGESGPARMVRQ